jgi:hypothetical protein
MDPSTFSPFANFLYQYRLSDVQAAVRRICSARVVDVKTWPAVAQYAQSISGEHQQAIRAVLAERSTLRPEPYPTSSTTNDAQANLEGRIPIGNDGPGNPSTSYEPGRTDVPMDVDECPFVGADFMKCVDRATIDGCVEEFIERTNNAAMRQEICTSCTRLTLTSTMVETSISDIPNRHVLSPATPHPSHELTDGMLLAGGIQPLDALAFICTECIERLKKGRRPKFSLANGMWVGRVPPELQGLTLPERILISLSFPAAYIVKLFPSGRRCAGWQQDRLNSGLRGNVSTLRLDQQQISNMHQEKPHHQKCRHYIGYSGNSQDSEQTEGNK